MTDERVEHGWSRWVRRGQEREGVRSGDGEAAPEVPPLGQLGDWPRGGLVEVLSRWEASGGQWRILAETERWLTVGLFSCDGGEEMTRVTGERTAVVAAYLVGRVVSS